MSPDGAADPFIDQVRDYPKTFLKPKSKAYDKVMFANAMDGLQSKIKSDPQHVSTYYYQIATGLYNASRITGTLITWYHMIGQPMITVAKSGTATMMITSKPKQPKRIT